MEKKNVSHPVLSDETPRVKIGRPTAAVYNASESLYYIYTL